MEIKNSETFNEFEILRGFAIIGVLVLHSFSDLHRIDEINFVKITLIPISTLSEIGVPLFLFISGFILYSKYNNNYKTFNFYKKRFKRIIPAYLVFSFLYEFYFFIFKELHFQVNLVNIYKIIMDLLTATSFYHFWFFGLIFNFYLFYPLINKIVNKFKDKINYILFFSIIIQLFWNSIHFYFFSKLYQIAKVTLAP